MSDFERFLGDSLKSIRDDHVRSIAPEVPAVREQLIDKVRSRRIVFFGGGLALAAAVLAAILFVVQTLPQAERNLQLPPATPASIVRTIEIPGEVKDIATGAGSVWVAYSNVDEPDGIGRIDPLTGELEETLSLRRADAIAAGTSRVYAADTSGGIISLVGSASDETTMRTRGWNAAADGLPVALEVADDTVWYAAQTDRGNEFSTLVAVDPETLERRGQGDLGSYYVTDMALAADHVWLSVTGPSGHGVMRVDEAAFETTYFALDEREGSANLAVGAGAVWVTRTGLNEVWKLDPESGERLGVIAVPYAPTSVAVGEGSVWVGTGPAHDEDVEGLPSRTYRIDPETLQVQGDALEAGGYRVEVEVGEGYVWTGHDSHEAIVQIAPGTPGSDPEPAPSESPSPEASASPSDEGTALIEQECLTAIPFEPTLSGLTGAEVGSGGQVRIPLREQNPQAIVSYRFAEGAFVDVLVGPLLDLADEEIIEVLGDKARLGAIHEGYSVVFETRGCSYQLAGYGIPRGEVRRFAESLVPRGEGNLTTDAFALWPDPTPEGAYAACFEQTPAFRRDPLDLASEFAKSVLLWPDVAVQERASSDTEMQIGISRIGYTGGPGTAASVDVIARQVAAGCWVVWSASTLRDGAALSVGREDGDLRITFDLADAAPREDVVRLVLEAEGARGSQNELHMSADDFERRGSISLGGDTPERPTYFAVYLYDRDSRVIGFIGNALPSGNFGDGS